MKTTSQFKTLREFVDSKPRRMTQGDIARELEISESALSSYLSGARVPNREIALRLAKTHNISLEGLLTPSEAHQ